ncbi:MAG: hypothetical protein NZ770_04215, partial [Candidatus Poseidoniaceae archaeon]|nr:hypothetical protein [Candidatus Poseidoniaceae archaeon]
GANRLDEKILEELRRQEDEGIETPKEMIDADEEDVESNEAGDDEKESEENEDGDGWTSLGTGQQTLGV